VATAGMKRIEMTQRPTALPAKLSQAILVTSADMNQNEFGSVFRDLRTAIVKLAAQ
jgi:hypothetical protein